MPAGNFIRKLREDRHMTQEDVAKQAGVSAAWLSKVENNLTRTPDPKRLRAIARPLGADPEELLAEAGYLSRGNREPTVEELSTDELMSRIARFLAEVNRRARRRPRPDEADPSVRRHAPTRAAVAFR